jgi:hypothetical protein
MNFDELANSDLRLGSEIQRLQGPMVGRTVTTSVDISITTIEPP